VKVESNAVAHKFSYDRASVPFSVSLDGPPDISDSVPGSNHSHSCLEAVSRHFDDSDPFWHRLAHKKGLAGISIIAFQNRRHIHVDDVSIFESPFAGYAMADLVIDRHTDALGKAAVVEGAGLAPFRMDRS